MLWASGMFCLPLNPFLSLESQAPWANDLRPRDPFLPHVGGASTTSLHGMASRELCSAWLCLIRRDEKRNACLTWEIKLEKLRHWLKVAVRDQGKDQKMDIGL